jgi:hypothetical protein
MITRQQEQVLEHFAEGRRLYKLMKFAEARDAFLRALGIDSEDGPSRVYYTRCKRYIENPPPEDWDGVYKMETK